MLCRLTNDIITSKTGNQPEQGTHVTGHVQLIIRYLKVQVMGCSEPLRSFSKKLQYLILTWLEFGHGQQCAIHTLVMTSGKWWTNPKSADSQPCVDDLSYLDGYTDPGSLRFTFGLCEAWHEEQISEMLLAMQQQACLVKKECTQCQRDDICRTT